MGGDRTTRSDDQSCHGGRETGGPGGGGRAIFLITHRISTIQRADNILYLDAGHIIESGDHGTLMGLSDGRYRAFVEAESNLKAGSGAA